MTALLAQIAQQPQGPITAIVTAILTIGLPILIELYRRAQQDKADRRLALVRESAHLAFDIVREFKAMNPGKVINSLEFGLSKFEEILAQQGVAPSPADLNRAAATFSALHGQEKAAVPAVVVTSELAASDSPKA